MLQLLQCTDNRGNVTELIPGRLTVIEDRLDTSLEHLLTLNFLSLTKSVNE